MSDIVRVEGREEVIAAFGEVARGIEDKAALAEPAAEAMLPDMQRWSRRASGAMANGWETVPIDEGQAFDNVQYYWTFQEFGTEEIEPMYVIPRAWEANEKDILRAFDESVSKVAALSGFEQ